MMPMGLGVSSKANIRYTVKEIIIYSVNLFYIKKGNSSLKKLEKSNFISVFSGLPFSFFNIV